MEKANAQGMAEATRVVAPGGVFDRGLFRYPIGGRGAKLCTLRAVQHTKIDYSAVVFTAVREKVLFQVKKARREVDCHDTVGSSGEATAGRLPCRPWYPIVVPRSG